MKITRASVPLFALSLFLLGGCASTPPGPDASASHPANPRAVQSPVPPAEPILMNLTNVVMVQPVADPATEHQHHHEAKPESTTPPTHEHN